MAWTWEDLSSDYELIDWLKSNFTENDDIKLFIQPGFVVYPPTVHTKMLTFSNYFFLILIFKSHLHR